MKRWLYFGLLGLFMFCSGLFFSFQDKSEVPEKYKLVCSFYDWEILECPGMKDAIVFNYFFYDDPTTKFNVDLMVCFSRKGDILHMRKIDENGQWQIIEKPPAGLPYKEILKEITDNLEAILKVLEKDPHKKDIHIKENSLSNFFKPSELRQELFFIDQLFIFGYDSIKKGEIK